MVPRSVLNDLRRKAVQRLVERREQRHAIADPDALDHIRKQATCSHSALGEHTSGPRLYALARNLPQLQAIIEWSGAVPLGMAYAEFEDVRRCKEAVALAKSAGMPIGLATTRIIKPDEEGLLRQIADCEPDAILVRNLAGLTFFKETAPGIPLIADYAMNIANEITASIMAENGIARMVPSYDLSWKQLAAMLRRFPVQSFEAVIHQHMPMFHM